MRIPKLNIRKRVGKKSGSPLHDDPNLVNFLVLLRTVDDYNSFETWREAFLERFGYFLVDESIERSKEAYQGRLKLKIEELVRNISIIARHVNDGNLSYAHVTDQARNSLNDGMKSCEDVSTCLKVFCPSTVVEEENIGFSKYNTAAILVETCFKEYELLNMCRDILQVLREKFINLVAEPQHLAAFNNYEQGIISFKSIILEDVGLLPVLKKQRQLKAPNPPKSLIAEIRRRVLREALVSKSLDAKQAAQGNKNGHNIVESNPTVMKLRFDKRKVDRMPKERLLSHNSLCNDKVCFGNAIDQDSSIVDIKRQKISAIVANRRHVENSSFNEVTKIKRTTKNIRNKSPPKRRLAKNNPQRLLRQSIDDTEDIYTGQSSFRLHHKSKNPQRDLNEQSLEMYRISSRREGIKNTANSEHDKCDPGSLTRKQIRIRTGCGTSDSPVTFAKLDYSSKLSSEDKKTDLVYCRKKNSKNKDERVRKGKHLLKSPVRARSIVSKRKGLEEALRKKRIPIEVFPVVHNEVHNLPVMKGEDCQFDTRGQNVTVKGSASKPSKCKKSPRNGSHKKSENQRRGYSPNTESEFLVEKGVLSNGIESHCLSSNGKSTKQSAEKPENISSRGDKIHIAKSIGNSKSLKQKQKKKKNSWMIDDYKKIVHRKAYSSHAKKVLSNMNLKGQFPGLSDKTILQEGSKPTENIFFGSKFEILCAKQDDKLSSTMLPSLLDNCTSLCQDEDESETLQEAAPIKEKDRSHTNSTKFECRLPLLGYLRKKSALISLDDGKLKKEGADTKSFDFDANNQEPSFYENFIKPLTMTKYDSIGKNEGECLYKDRNRWETEKDVFEDSVCSSRRRSTNSSVAAAIAKFYSDESIVELLRLNEIGKQKDSTKEIPSQWNRETKLSSITVINSKNIIIEGMTEAAESMNNRKMWDLRTEEVELLKELYFFENNELYDVHNQTKEILSVEEDTNRMEDEVAKIKIVLEDNQHMLDCIGLDFEVDGDSLPNEFTSLKLKDDSDIYCTSLDEEMEERHIIIDEISSKSKEDEELEMVEKMFNLEAREDEVLSNCNDVDEEKCVYDSTDDFAFESNEYEELQMAEEMFQREAKEASNEILSTSHLLGQSSKGNESLNLVPSNQTQKSSIGYTSRHKYNYESSFPKTNDREYKGINHGRSVMVYDPSARLSRYKAPRNARVPLFIA